MTPVFEELLSSYGHYANEFNVFGHYSLLGATIPMTPMIGGLFSPKDLSNIIWGLL